MSFGKPERTHTQAEHARRRVGFFRKILESHLALPSVMRDAEWDMKADLYRRRFAATEQELRRVEALATQALCFSGGASPQ
jgi:hypothetical protein